MLLAFAVLTFSVVPSLSFVSRQRINSARAVENTAVENTVTENTTAENTAAENTAAEKTAQEKTAVYSGETDWNFTNLVVFARFADESEFINAVYEQTKVRNIIDNTYEKSEYAVSDYFSNVSFGKVNMKTLYLFAEGGSLVLSKNRGYYAEKDELNPEGYEKSDENLRLGELCADWSGALSEAFGRGNKPSDVNGGTLYDYSDLDKNNDGKIDCITVIYKNTEQNISVSWSSPLWDYHYYTSGVSVSENGKTYRGSDYVQLTFSYALSSGESVLYKASDGLPVVTSGKICHETFHVLGLKDLYRSDGSSEVYFMSVMGKPISPVPQSISVKEAEALGLLGENSIKTITSSGSYELETLTAESDGVVGYKIELPSSDKTLYLEYRNFDGVNKYDDKAKTIYSCRFGNLVQGQKYLKSGLVCYLSKSGTRYPSNLGTVGSNWNYAVVSNGVQSTKIDCAVGENETLDITDNLTVTVTGISDGTLRFDIEGDALGGEHTHTLIKTEEVKPTCISEGRKAYYRCAECGKYFSAENSSVEVDYGSLTIGKNSSAHSYGEWIAEIPPTTEKEGVKAHRDCLSCGKHFDINFNEITDLTIDKKDPENESVKDSESVVESDSEKDSEKDSESDSVCDSDKNFDNNSDNNSDKSEENSKNDNDTSGTNGGKSGCFSVMNVAAAPVLVLLAAAAVIALLCKKK